MISHLPLQHHIETREVLRLCARARAKLGELNGTIVAVPNKDILINTLFLQEAKASSEIENIVTTDDELFRSKIEKGLKPATKEVRNYETALKKGWNLIKEKKILSNNDIIDIQGGLFNYRAGFRKQKGTVLKNNLGEVVYEPPQNPAEILQLMNNLEKYINDRDICPLDPLIKMAIMHHQFESIHPFYDGNGRVGRIINILFLVLHNLLDIPILYLSRYIIEHKNDYYRLLQEVRENDTKWEEWILFMLKGVEEIATQNISLIKRIVELMQKNKHFIRDQYPKIYSQDLINSLFKYPYTKIGFLAKDINKERRTAKKYLDTLAEENILKKEKIGRSNYYFNVELINLFVNIRDF